MYTTSIVLITLLLFAGCSTRTQEGYLNQGKVTAQPTLDGAAPTPSDKDRLHPTMRPYTVHGKRYYPTIVHVGEEFHGRASWYGPDFHGKKTSNGETYDMHAMTAAHKTLPMNTVVRVTHKENGRSIIVRINDRGPFVDSRIIDLSKKGASELDMIRTGTAPVRLEVLGFEAKGSRSISPIETLKQGPKEQVSGIFSVQVGAFVRIEGAMATREKYHNMQGYSAVIKDSQYEKGRIFRVYVTGFKSDAEARDFIANNGLQHAFIVME